MTVSLLSSKLDSSTISKSYPSFLSMRSCLDVYTCAISIVTELFVVGLLSVVCCLHRPPFFLCRSSLCFTCSLAVHSELKMCAAFMFNVLVHLINIKYITLNTDTKHM